MNRWPGGNGDVWARWPGRPRRLPSVRPPEWCFQPPECPDGPNGLPDRSARDEWWQRCRRWCEDADYSVLDLLRLRGWRRGHLESRYPDDPPDLFPPELFGIDR
jgi:hypothetical protein